MNNNTHPGIVLLWLIMCGRNQVFCFADLRFTVERKKYAKKNIGSFLQDSLHWITTKWCTISDSYYDLRDRYAHLTRKCFFTYLWIFWSKITVNNSLGQSWGSTNISILSNVIKCGQFVIIFSRGKWMLLRFYWKLDFS